MDLAYVDKLAKDNYGVKYLLVGQDLFDRTVDAKGMKTKDSKETVMESSICRTYNTLTQKHFLSLYGGLAIQWVHWVQVCS